MNLFEEFKLYETMWDRTSFKESATEYDETEVKACLDRVNSAASTQPSFDDKYGNGRIFVSVSEELLKKALRIGNRGTYPDNAPQATTIPAQAVDDMVIYFNFEEDDEWAIVSLMLGGEDDTYYEDICVVGWGDHIAGLSDVKDMKSAKTFFETQLVPNANKIAEDIINDSWAYYQLSDYAGITTYGTAVTESTTGTEDEWQDYGSLDEALTEADDLYGYGPYKTFSDPDLKVGDYVLTRRSFDRSGRTYPARITDISSNWINYEISGFGFIDKGTKARPGSQAADTITKARTYMKNLK